MIRRACARLARLLCALLLASAPLSARQAGPPPEQFHHSSWTIEDGAPPDIWAIAQTPDGFLWLGTGGGLYRFDGIRFEEIHPSGDAMVSRNITALLATPDGDLWLGFYTGQIARLRAGRLTSFGTVNDSIERFLRAPDGTLWAALWRGPNHLLRFDGGRWHAVPSAPMQIPYALNGAVVTRDGTIWVGTAQQILRLRLGDARLTPVATMPPGGGVVASGGGVTVVRGPGATAGVPALPALSVPRAIRDLRRGLIDRHGALWWTDSDGGVSRFVPDETDPNHKIDHWDDRRGLTANAAVPIFEDREGAIWVGTNLGLDRFRRAPLVRADAFGPDPYRAYLQAVVGDGTLYVVTRALTLGRAASDGAIDPILRLSYPPSMIAADGDRLLVEQNNAVFALQGRRLVRLALPPLPGQAEAWSRDAAGTPTIAIRGRGIFRLSQGQWRMLPVTGHPDIDRQLEIPVGMPAGRWFYANDRLLLCEPAPCRRMPGVAVGRINTLLPGSAPGDPLLVGGDSGIALGQAGHFRSLGADRLPALVGISGIARGPGDTLWINGLRGIVQTTQTALAATLADGQPLRYRLYTMADGLPGAAQQDAHYSTALRGGDGRIWFAASHGVAWIDPARIERNRVAPPVVLRSVTVDGHDRPLAPILSLPPGTRRVQFDYAALSLLDPERVQFRYRLSGVDEAWVDPGQRRQATYTNLAPGRWAFQVIAANADGVWNTRGAAIELIVEPLFYQTWWFRLLATVAAAAALALLYLARRRVTEERTRRLVAAKIAERERIARELHDTLLQGVHGLMLRFQAVANILPPDSRAQQMLEAALERGDDVQLEGRDRVLQLRTVGSDTLQAALHILAHQIGDSLTIEIVERGSPRALCDPVIEELTAIAREALTNTLWHAGASHAVVTLDFTRAALILTIRDNGRGFGAALLRDGAKAGHFGLPGMRERVAQLGGRLRLADLDSGGAEIVVRVPARVAYAQPNPLGRAIERIFGAWRWPRWPTRTTYRSGK